MMTNATTIIPTVTNAAGAIINALNDAENRKTSLELAKMEAQMQQSAIKGQLFTSLSSIALQEGFHLGATLVNARADVEKTRIHAENQIKLQAIRNEHEARMAEIQNKNQCRDSLITGMQKGIDNCLESHDVEQLKAFLDAAVKMIA